MDREGFRQLLINRKVAPEKMEASIDLAERFEKFIAASGGRADATTTWAFCQLLIQEEQNTYDNLVTVARYGRFTRNNDIYIAILELLDGAEAQPNLYKKVAETFGETVRDEVFTGVGEAPLGVPGSEKPRLVHPVIKRLVERQGEEAVEELLSSCLRDLPDTYYRGERRKYLKAHDIDEYIKKRHQSFVRRIQKCLRNGELFFAQKITDEVVKFVKENPEIESGVREGNILYVSKIPYNTKAFLVENDPVMKRYHACHCPWAREAIKNGESVEPIFCYCSGGFSKKSWEVIFGQTLRVEVLESALQGDFRCRFAIHLPNEFR